MKIKICGVTTLDDAAMVAASGADWIGLNFHPPSKRFVEEATARQIVDALPPSVEAVGLFVNRPPDEVAAIARRVGIEIVQLHGEEPPEDVAALGDFQVVRAFRIGADADLAEMVHYIAKTKRLGRMPDAILIDAKVEGHFGGSGGSIDEGLFPMIRSFVDAGCLPRLILAGGLSPENVASKAERLRPWMVDVAGGVESSPGRKDFAKVAAFIKDATGGK